MPYQRKYLNPRTMKIELVEAYKGRRGYCIIRNDLPTSVRNRAANCIFTHDDDEFGVLMKAGHSGRAKRVGDPKSKANAFKGLKWVA